MTPATPIDRATPDEQTNAARLRIAAYTLLLTGLAAGSCSLLLPTAKILGWIRPNGLPDAESVAQLEDGIWLTRACAAFLALASLACGAWLRRVVPSGAVQTEAPDAPAPVPPCYRIGLPLLLLVATALRVPALDSGLWYDEVLTLVEFVRLPLLEVITTFSTFNNHLFFSALARLSLVAFGESTWALRLPAMLLGIASLWAIWRVGLETATAREAFFATALCAFSYHHVWFSQNARGYTGIVFLTTAATALFLSARRSRDPLAWIAYGWMVALSTYTHLSAGCVFAAHGIVYLADEGVRMRDARTRSDARSFDGWPLLGFGLGALLTAVLYAPVVPQVLARFAARINLSPEAAQALGTVEEWKNPLWTVIEILGGLTQAFGVAGLGVVAVAGLIGFVGFTSYARRTPTATALMLLPIPVTAGVLLAISFHLWPRYFLISIGFLALMLMRGIFVGCEWVSARAGKPALGGRLATGVACTVVGLSALSLPANYAHPKQAFAAARDFVQAERGKHDVVIVGLAQMPYDRHFAPGLAGWSSAATLAELENAARGEGVWVIYTFPTQLAAAFPEISAALETRATPVRRFPGTLGDGDLYVTLFTAE